MQILIIDDEATVRELFCRLAQIRGWEEVDAVSTRPH